MFISTDGARTVAESVRAPLVVLTVCIVGIVGWLARDFLIPTAAGLVLALILTPVSKRLERLRVPSAAAAGLSVLVMTAVVVGLVATAIPSIQDFAQQAPLLAIKLERKLAGVREKIAQLEEVSKQVERATTPAPAPTPATGPGATAPAAAPEKVVVRERSLLSELAVATPAVVLQLAYAVGLAFFLLSNRNANRRQILRIPRSHAGRLRLARVMRAIYDRVGHYLFALTVIYSGVAVVSAIGLALIGLPNAAIWGAVMGVAAFIPFIGSPIVVILVAIAAAFTFEDWPRIVGAPALLVVIHVIESQFLTPSIVGKRCALNTVAVFAGIALLGWMWGAVGALVAVPLLILIVTVAEQLRSLRWLAVLLSDEAAIPPTPQEVRRRARMAMPAARR